MEYDKIMMLIDIVNKLHGHPKLKTLHDAAMRELELMAENHPEPVVEDEGGKEDE